MGLFKTAGTLTSISWLNQWVDTLHTYVTKTVSLSPKGYKIVKEIVILIIQDCFVQVKKEAIILLQFLNISSNYTGQF